MYAYVYNKKLNKYYSLHESQITNFKYLDVGHQSKEFASKPFQCRIKSSTAGATTIPCQILSVGEDLETLYEYITEHRPAVPKLNASDLDSETPSHSNQKKKAKLDAKASILKKKNSAVKTSSKITDEYNKQLKECDDDDVSNDSDEHSDIASSITSKNELDIKSDDSNESDHLNESEKIAEVNNELDDSDTEVSRDTARLKEELKNERRLKLHAIKLNTKLQEMYKQVKEKMEKKTAEQDQEKKAEEVKELKRKVFGFPTPISTDSNIQVRSSALEEAYSKTEPSTFYINLCYAAWGYKELSTRCVKITKRTKDKTRMTPKKRKAIRQHFEHFMNHYQYGEVMVNIHLGKLNSYANRAIGGAKKHVQKMQELNIDEFSEDDEANPLIAL